MEETQHHPTDADILQQEETIRNAIASRIPLVAAREDHLSSLEQEYIRGSRTYLSKIKVHSIL